MKKILFVIILIAVALSCTPVIAYADTLDDLKQNVTEGIGSIDFSDVDDIAGEIIGSTSDKVEDIVNGEFDTIDSFFSVTVSFVTESINGVLPQLATIFAVLIIVGLIRHLSGGMISQNTDGVISFMGVTVVFTSVISLIVDIYKQLYQTLNSVAVLTDASMPILLTLLVANGGTALSSVCQPSMVMFSTVVIKIITAIILPISIFAMIFAVVGNISSDVKVNKLSGFLNSVASWILGIIFMLFSAFTSVQGITAASVDGVSLRAAKFATKSYVPILGGYLADGFDIVMASTSLIKNAFGAVTLLVMFFIIVKPLISILVINLGLQAVSALTEPVVDEKYTKILSGMSKTLTFLAVLVLAVAFMFSILALIAISSANMV